MILKPDSPGTGLNLRSSDQVALLMHEAELLALTLQYSSCDMLLLWVFNNSDLLSYIWIP